MLETGGNPANEVQTLEAHRAHFEHFTLLPAVCSKGKAKQLYQGTSNK
jgi:hypothetical protein